MASKMADKTIKLGILSFRFGFLEAVKILNGINSLEEQYKSLISS